MSVGRECGLVYSGESGFRNTGYPPPLPIHGVDILAPWSPEGMMKSRYLPRKQGLPALRAHGPENEITMCLQCLAMMWETPMIGAENS